MTRVTDDAPPPAAPVAAPAPAAPSSVQPDSIEDIYADIHRPAPVVAAPAVAPAPAPAVEPPTPEGAPAPAAVPAPTPVVENQPGAEPAPIEAPAPESWLAPLFTLGNDEAAIDQATGIVKDLSLNDPIAYSNLAHGVYYADQQRMQALALRDLGVSPAKVQEFVTWAKSGQPLAAPQNAPAAFPVPDEYGMATLPSGRQVDTTTPEGAEIYDLAKFRHEQTQAEAQRTAEAERVTQQNEARLEQSWQTFGGNCLDECATTYMDARTKIVSDLVTPAIASLQGEDALLGQMFLTHAHQKAVESVSDIGVEASRDLQAIINDAVARGRAQGLKPEQIKASCLQRIQQGKMLTHAARQDQRIRVEVNKMVAQFSRMILARNRAEIAATVTDPKVPEGARTVTANAAPQANDLSQVTDINEVMRLAREQDRQNAAALRARQ